MYLPSFEYSANQIDLRVTDGNENALATLLIQLIQQVSKAQWICFAYAYIVYKIHKSVVRRYSDIIWLGLVEMLAIFGGTQRWIRNHKFSNAGFGVSLLIWTGFYKSSRVARLLIHGALVTKMW